MAEVAQDIEEPQVDDQQGGQPDPAEQYYNYLKKAGADVAPTFDSFKRTLSDDNSARQYYDYLRSNHFDAPDSYDSFAKTLSVKSAPSLPPVDYSKPVRQVNPSESTPNRVSAPLPATNSPTTANQLIDQHAKAQQFLKTELTNNNDIAPKIIQKEKEANRTNQGVADFAAQPRSDQPLTAPQQFDISQQPKDQPISVSPDEVNSYLQSVQTDPTQARAFLSQVTQHKPEKAAPIQSAMYLSDARDRADQTPDKAVKILQNAKKITSGDLTYDPQSGSLQKPEGAWQSIATGVKEKTKAFTDFNFFDGATQDQAISELENRRKNYDPDEPTPVPKGALAEMAGGMAGQPLKGIVAGKIAGAASAAVPGMEEFAPAVDKFITAAVSGSDFQRMSYVNYLQQHYNELRNQGIDPKEAYTQAQDVAKKQSYVDAAGGAAMMYAGGAIGDIKLPNFSLSEGFTKSVINGLKQGAKGIGEAGAVGLIQGAGQDVKNQIAEANNLPTDTSGKDIMEAMKSGALFTLGMAAIAKGANLLSGKTRMGILQGLSKATPEQINAELGQQLMSGHITPQEAQSASAAITEHRLTDQSIPPNVTDEARFQIQDKIKRRDYLETQLESADKAFHPDIKEKINAVNDDILELAKNTKPRGDEDILSQKPTDNGEKTNGDAQTEGQVEKPTEGTAGTGQAETVPSIHPTTDFRTWNLGDMEGKPEDEAAKKHLEGVVREWDKHPAGETGGEPFGQFVNRVIPAFDKILKEQPNNTTIVTHSSVLKAMRVWDEMGRPSMQELNGGSMVKKYDGPLDMKGYSPDSIMHFNQGYDKNRVSLVVDPEAKSAYSKQLADRKRISGGSGSGMKHPLRDIAKEFRDVSGKDVIVDLRGIDIKKPIPEIKKELNENSLQKEFATKYNETETHNGDLETFKGDKGDIHVIRHGQTEDNEKNNFRSGDTNLTPKGEKQAAEVGGELGRKSGGDVPKIITSDLPRAIHTSNIIHGEMNGENVPRGTFHEGQNIQSTHFEGERPITHVGDDHVVVQDPAGDHIKHEIPLSDVKTQNNANATSTADSEMSESTGDGKVISTKNRVADEIRGDNGLPPVEIPKDRATDESLNAWRNGTRHPLEIVSQLLSDKDIYDKSITPNDEPIMREYIRGLVNRGVELNKELADLDAKAKAGNESAVGDAATTRQQLLNHYDEMQRALDAERIGGNIWHKYGMERQMAVNEQGQVINSISRIKTIYGDDMPDVVKKQLTELQRKNDELTAKNQKIVEDNKKLQSENELLKQNQGAKRAKGTKKTDADFTRERKDILSDMKDSLKEASKKMYATLPGVPQLAAIAPHVLKLFKSFGEQGVIKLDEAVGKIHDLVKDVLEGVTKEDIKEIIQGKYTAAADLKKQGEATQRKIDRGVVYKPPTVKRLWEKDPDWIKNNREQANLKLKLRNLEQQAFDSKKSLIMKAEDWFNRWGRRIIFFGANAVYTKLSSAAVVGAFAHRLPETLAGKINAKFFPHIAKNAPIEGNLNAASEAKFYKEFLNPVKFVKNVWSQAKSGETPLSKELGGHSNERHIPIVDLFAADAHAMIKDPVKRATFEAALTAHLKFYADNGIDGTHPLMLESARQAAYKTAMYDIFQNKPKITSGVNKFFNDLEQSGVANRNLPDRSSRVKGNWQYTAASLYHFFVPVNSVPANILERIGLGISLPRTMIKAMSQNKDIRNGILNMTQEDSDLLMRQLKKGQIGAAYWTLGFILGGSALGGLYTKYDPDKERVNGPKTDEMNVLDTDIPKDWQHNYQFQSAQMGATWRTVHDHYIDDKGESQMEAIAKATAATAGAALQSIPALQGLVKGVEGTTGNAAGEKWVKDLEKRMGFEKATTLLNMMGYGDSSGGSTDGGGAKGQWAPTVKEFK